jgi:hypothetical protein
MKFSEVIDNVEVLREVAEFAYQNLQRVLNEKSDYTKSFEWNELSESLFINDSTLIKMKRLRNKEDDEGGDYDPHKLCENGNEEEEEEEKEEEEEEEEEVEEPPFPKHPSMCCGITWENIAESLSQDTLPSTLYKELPRQVYFAFQMCILEGHTKYLKNELHLGGRKLMNPMKSWRSSFLLKTSLNIVLIKTSIRFKIEID